MQADFGSLGINSRQRDGGDFGADIASTLTSAFATPADALVKKYTQIAITEGTKALMIQAVLFSLITYFIVDAVARKYGKKNLAST